MTEDCAVEDPVSHVDSSFFQHSLSFDFFSILFCKVLYPDIYKYRYT